MMVGVVAAVLDPRTDVELAEAIAAGHRELCRVQRRLLADVAEHDRRQAWRAHGATSEAKFLEGGLGVSWRTANAWVRVGHALDRRPGLGEHFEDATFSFDHLVGLVDVMAAEEANAVAPLGPFDEGGPDPSGAEPTGSDPPAGEDPANGAAVPGGDPAGPSAPQPAEDGAGSAPTPGAGSDPDGGEPGGPGCGGGPGGGVGPSDAELIDLANRMSPAQLASMARRLRQRSADEAAAAHRRRRISAWLDPDTAQLRLTGGLFDLQAHNVWAALVDYATTCSADPVSGVFDPLEVRFADALDAMATAYLAGRGRMTHRPAVIVHADASILDGADGWAQTSTGAPVASETVRRLLCSCELTAVINDKLGDPLRLGRTKRTPTWQLAEMVRRRDGGCRFPGCRRKLWIHTHHVAEWDRDHGPTDYENLCGLCSFHHHLCHEGRWKIHGDPCGELVFVDPTGTVRLSSWPNQAQTRSAATAVGDRRGPPGHSPADQPPSHPPDAAPDWGSGPPYRPPDAAGEARPVPPTEDDERHPMADGDRSGRPASEPLRLFADAGVSG